MKKHYNRLIKLLIVGFLLPACREQETAIKQVSRTKADESRLIISSEPSRICIATDSTAFAVVNGETIYLYNYLNGKLLETWQPSNFPADSLIRNYYQRVHPDRQYIVPVAAFNKEHQLAGLRLYDLQLLPDDQLCISMSISTPFERIMDGKKEGLFNYSDCLILCNWKTKSILRIIPFQTEISPSSFAFFAAGFYIKQDRVWTNHLADSLTEYTPALVTYDLRENNPRPALLPVYYPAFFPQDWVFYHFFREEGADLLVSNQEHIYSAVTGKAIQTDLVDNRKHEFLMNFSLSHTFPGKIFYHLFYNDPASKKYGNALCIYDTKSQRRIEQVAVTPDRTLCAADFYNDKIITLHKEGEHYYFTRYAYRP